MFLRAIEKIITVGSVNLVTTFQTSFNNCKSCCFFSLSTLVDPLSEDDVSNTKHIPKFRNNKCLRRITQIKL